MAYDATKPADHSPISAGELRSQFQGLKQLNDAVPALLDEQLPLRTAGNCDGISYSSPTISDPPTQAEVQALSDALDNLISALKQH